MDLKKILLIIRKDLRLTLQDRGTLLLMFVAPLVLSLIIGAAFSGFIGSNDVSISTIDVAIVNEDEGAQILFQRLSYGQILTDILVPGGENSLPADNQLYQLVRACVMTRDEATAQVDNGNVTAAILIPATFSASLNPLNPRPTGTEITVYRDPGAPLTGQIVSSIVRAIVTQIASGTVAIFAAGDVDPILKAQGQQITQDVVALLSGDNSPVKVENITVTGERVVTFDPLQYFPPAMLVFFLLFTTTNAAATIIEERENGTMQRMVISPTDQLSLLVGKLGGVFAIGCVQVVILIIMMAFIAPILGSPRSVWGTNIPAIALMVICTVFAATGVGALIVGFTRTSQQADTYGNALIALLGMVGGAFLDVSSIPVLRDLAKGTPNWWGTNGFSTLARTSDLNSVLPNITALIVIGVITFSIGALLVRRRLATG